MFWPLLPNTPASSSCFNSNVKRVRAWTATARVNPLPSRIWLLLTTGFASVHALPMRLRENILGTLGLFGTRVGALNDDDLALGQALADVASVAIVQEKVAADKTVLNEQLQTALTSRVIIEQAKGVLAHSGQLEMADAFAVLLRYARDHNLRLTDVAHDLVIRALSASQLLQHSADRKAKAIRSTR
jgi:ANTAR domain